MGSSVVVGVDFSETSRRAIDAAIALAKDLDAPLVMVYAFEPPPRAAKGHLDPISQARADNSEDEWKKMSGAWADRARKLVTVDVVAREGKPADVIIEEATRRGARFIVVGKHGRTALQRAVMGSVANDLVSRSPVPVVVVPPK